jgi:hypothetical protein
MVQGVNEQLIVEFYFALLSQSFGIPSRRCDAPSSEFTAMPKRLGKFGNCPSQAAPKVEEGATPTYAEFLAEPFEAGVRPHHLGNSLPPRPPELHRGGRHLVDRDPRA